MRNVMAGVIAAALAASSCLATPEETKFEIAQGSLAHWLENWSEHNSLDVSMTVTWSPKAGHEFLHCKLTNTSAHSVVLDSELLPWKAFVAITFIPFNASGRAVFVDTRPITFGVPYPIPLVLGVRQTIEGDIDFSTLPFFGAASSEDLFVFWVAHATLYSEPKDAAHGSSDESVELPMRGITFVPRRPAPKGR